MLALFVISLVGFMAFRMVQFARYLREHPHQAQPGELEFREANREIIAGHGNTVFGNSGEARALATDYAKSLKILREAFFSKGNPGALASLEGEFLTYCQLNGDSCVFLVHVPELRRFSDEAKKSLTDLAWINAQSVLQAKRRPPPKTVAVGVKGLMLYDAILIGDYVANPQSGKDGINIRGSGLVDTELFYPFFVPREFPARQPNSSTNSPSTER